MLYGAGNETRTRDPDLGKVVLYQLSYSRNLISDEALTHNLKGFLLIRLRRHPMRCILLIQAGESTDFLLIQLVR